MSAPLTPKARGRLSALLQMMISIPESDLSAYTEEVREELERCKNRLASALGQDRLNRLCIWCAGRGYLTSQYGDDVLVQVYHKCPKCKGGMADPSTGPNNPSSAEV